MDAVAIAQLVSDGRVDIDGNATFKIESILRGTSLLEVGQTVEAVYFGPGKSDKKFLLLGVDPRNLVWSSPLPLSAEAVRYVEAIQSLPDDPIVRLDFYQKHFEHPDSLLARDSYDEFALAPYEDVKKLKDKMDRKQLLAWIRDPAKSPDRKRLYYTMLGICGYPEDAEEFEDMIESDDPEKRAGLDALIAAYLMLKGEDGLKLIDEQFLANRKSSYPDVYSAVMALRFHGTEVQILPKEEILKSMRHLLEAPDLADLVIPDLARWGDWSQIDRLTELFKNANDDNSWVRVPVVNYLRACPLPEAKTKLEELEKIDPKAVKRAATFFPIPAPANTKPKQNDNSSWSPLMPFGQPIRGRLAQASQRSLAITNQVLLGWQLGDDSASSTALSANLEHSASSELVSADAAVSRMNSFRWCSVIFLAGAVLGSLMWMVAAGMFGGEIAFVQRCTYGYITFRRG
jgi:ribosomal protein L24E